MSLIPHTWLVLFHFKIDPPLLKNPLCKFDSDENFQSNNIYEFLSVKKEEKITYKMYVNLLLNKTYCSHINNYIFIVVFDFCFIINFHYTEN